MRTADDVAECVAELVPIYQTAFAGPPWFEVAVCEAPEGFGEVCTRRRSPDLIGETCSRCGEILRRPVHRTDELRERWINRFREAESRFYLERLEDGTCLLAALAWGASPATIAAASYASPEERQIHDWLGDELPAEFVWLEEIFAHQVLRKRGNLQNYGEMVRKLLRELDSTVFVFRTKNERLVEKTRKTFPAETTILAPPADERSLILVELSS